MGGLPQPDSFDEHTLVEYVETLLLVEAEGHLSLAELSSSFPSGQRPTNTDLGLIRSEINRRAFMLPGTYPYRADQSGVFRLANRHVGLYDFLLLLSIERAPYRRDHRFNEANRLFDFAVREGLKALLGDGSDAVRFGTPVQDQRPEQFERAIAWLAERMGVATLVDDLPVDDNDSGVDVIAWRPFSTGRSGFPVWLAQCTVQMSYEQKALGIPVHLWKLMLDIGPTPQTALAIPFTVRANDDRWMKVSLAVSTLLDRVRICELLEAPELRTHTEFAQMEDFVKNELAILRTFDYDEDPATTGSDAKPPRIAKPRRQRPSTTRNPLRR